jgi:hypothetical protein
MRLIAIFLLVGWPGGVARAENSEPDPNRVDTPPQDLTLSEDTAEGPKTRMGEAWATRPFSIELHLGIATPLGLGGVMLEVAPVRWVSLGCGIGTNVVGVEVACMSRVRAFVRAERAFNLGVGVSGGSYMQSKPTRYGALAPLLGAMDSMGESPWPSEYYWERALWLNAELGYESRHQSGGSFRVYIGLGKLLNPADATPDPSGPDPGQHRKFERWDALPYAGVAWGYAF